MKFEYHMWFMTIHSIAISVRHHPLFSPKLEVTHSFHQPN